MSLDIIVSGRNALRFDKICRTCLSESDTTNLFSDNSVEKLKLSDMLSCFTSKKVCEYDNYPAQICVECIKELTAAYGFRQKCLRSETTLKCYINLRNQDMNERVENLIEEPNILYSNSEDGIEKSTDQLKNKHDIEHKTNASEKSENTNQKTVQYKCKRCNETFENFQQLSEHRKVVKHSVKRDQTCTICAKTFTCSQLKVHMRTHTREKPFSCEICEQSFSLKCNLQRHLLIHSGDRPFGCELCPKTFSQRTTLSEHMATHKDGEKNYLCSYCGRGFNHLAGLRSHSMIHTGIRPYPCAVCGKTFTHIGTMKSHMLIHTGQKPFICSVCGRAFTQRNHLRYHNRIHSGEKPFSCSVCSKTFSLKGNLTVHMRTHTGETPYRCPICSRGFYDSSSMKKHCKGHASNPTTTASHAPQPIITSDAGRIRMQ